jgi:hypothetical protein
VSVVVYAAAPALPLHTAGPYVAAAYIVFVVLVLVYLAIMGLRTSRTERELARLRRELQANEAGDDRHVLLEEQAEQLSRRTETVV